MSTSAEFNKAAEEVNQLKETPSQDDLLELYGLYKIAKGEDISKSKPGMFDLKGKYKKEAWQKLLDEGVTQEQAQERYIAKVEALKKAQA